MVIAAGLPVSARLLWFLAWKRRPLYILAAILCRLRCAFYPFALRTSVGVLPIAVLYKANQIVNAVSQEVIELAKNTTLKAGAQRVGVNWKTQTRLPC